MIPLKSPAAMIFDSYEVTDTGIRITFVCKDPGGGNPSDWNILITDAELALVITQADMANLVRSKLQRKFRAANLAAKLDAFIGQSVTI